MYAIKRLHNCIKVTYTISYMIFAKRLQSSVSKRNGQSKSMLLPGQDPWVLRYKNSYLLVQARDDHSLISIRKFKKLDAMSTSEERSIVVPRSDHNKLIWAPELHRFPKFSKKWYLYYAGCDGENRNHRMYVMESDTSDPMGSYHEIGKIYDKDNDYWAIDMTLFDWKGKLYGVWSGWEFEYKDTDFPQNLYIALMENPWTISGLRVCISTPTYEWEKSIEPINEGPQVLQENGNLFIVYSADASWEPAYKLGMLLFTGEDPLDPTSWVKYPKPVFSGTKEIFGPGHASFITEKKLLKKKSYIVYHSKISEKSGWEREIRMQPFIWTKEGVPLFGKPQ